MNQAKREIPAVARIMEAARSLKLEAQRLRAATPAQRASSQAAEVDIDPGGRLLALRLLDHRMVPAAQAGSHLLELYRAAAGQGSADGVVVTDLPPSDEPGAGQGLGPRRFQFPPGINDDAPAHVVMDQVMHRLRRHHEVALAAADTIGAVAASGSDPDGHAQVTLNSAGHLLELRTTSYLYEAGAEQANTALAEALDAARVAVNAEIEAVLGREGS